MKKGEECLSFGCSSMTLTSREGRPYWFRTCDIETDIRKEGSHWVRKGKEERVEVRGNHQAERRFSFMGISYDHKDDWLLDGMNEKGLVGGLLLLPQGTSVEVAQEGLRGCSGMELVTYMLSQCASVEEVKEQAKNLQILHIPYKESKVTATMHYFFVDQKGDEVVLEAADPSHPGRLKIYGREENIGIMTNAPIYAEQLANLSWFMSQSAELTQGLGEGPIQRLDFQGRVVLADSRQAHLSLNGSYPGSYSSHDRFIRLALLKSINHCGNKISDERMFAFGSNLMNAVWEPPNRGLLHYSHIQKDGRVVGQKESFTQYIVMYDLHQRTLHLRFMDSLSWQEYRL